MWEPGGRAPVALQGLRSPGSLSAVCRSQTYWKLNLTAASPVWLSQHASRQSPWLSRVWQGPPVVWKDVRSRRWLMPSHFPKESLGLSTECIGQFCIPPGDIYIYFRIGSQQSSKNPEVKTTCYFLSPLKRVEAYPA